MKVSRLTKITRAGCVVLLLAGCTAQAADISPTPWPDVPQIVPPTPTPAPVAPVPPAPPVVNPADLPPSIIAWDSVDKAVSVNFGEPAAKFQFALTNVSDAPVTVLAVSSSCGCTAAQVPPMPWVIAPGTNASFAVNMNLAGRNGTVIKTVTVASDKGTKHLLVRTTILPTATPTAAIATGSHGQNQ